MASHIHVLPAPIPIHGRWQQCRSRERDPRPSEERSRNVGIRLRRPSRAVPRDFLSLGWCSPRGLREGEGRTLLRSNHRTAPGSLAYLLGSLTQGFSCTQLGRAYLDVSERRRTHLLRPIELLVFDSSRIHRGFRGTLPRSSLCRLSSPWPPIASGTAWCEPRTTTT